MVVVKVSEGWRL